VAACPVGALREAERGAFNLDKRRCHARLLETASRNGADCCGKCAVGPCALGSAVGLDAPEGGVPG
jgi:hypothetical protein